MGIQKILSVILALALILSCGAGYAAEIDRAELNPFVWIDEFTDLCNYIGFDIAWKYKPGGTDEEHYFILFIKDMKRKEGYFFPVMFATDGAPGVGEVNIFCNFNAEDILDEDYVVQVTALFFAMARMTLSTEAASKQIDIVTLYEEGTECILSTLYQSPNGYYAYDSASGIHLQILGYERLPNEIEIVLSMQYTGLESLPEPGPDDKATIPQSTPQSGEQ